MKYRDRLLAAAHELAQHPRYEDGGGSREFVHAVDVIIAEIVRDTVAEVMTHLEVVDQLAIATGERR